jgi:excisionase family DNA binding protein
MEGRLLTVSEVAEDLAIHPKTVRRLVARGELAAVKIGAAVRVHPADVDAFVDEHRVQNGERRREPRPRVRASAARASFADRLRLKNP